MQYPISEVFTSPQGEGLYTGIMMTFIRLSGCSVGKPYPKDFYKIKDMPHCEFKCEGGDPDMGHGPTCTYAKNSRALPIYTEQCTLYDGRTFPCDTDYRVKARMDIENIISLIPENIKHVVITGGEPLIHNLEPLLIAIINSAKDRFVHLETSGTKLLTIDPAVRAKMWVTVSPKFPLMELMVSQANEIKLLVDTAFDWETVPESIKKHKRVYLQPVNSEWHVDKGNLKRCVELQKQHPEVGISLQLHKILGDYIGERVL